MSRFKTDKYFRLLILSIIGYLILSILPCPGDLTNYDVHWIEYMRNHGVTGMYDSFYINYPPMYPLWLHFVVRPFLDAINYTAFSGAEIFYQCGFWFMLRSFALISHIIAVIWFVKKYDCRTAFYWSINPGMILVYFYGQRDELFCLFIFMMFYYLRREKYTQSFLIIALLGYLKPQFVFFVIPLFCYALYDCIYKDHKIVYLIQDCFISISAWYLMWLPFVIASKNALYPFLKTMDFLMHAESAYDKGASTLYMFFIFNIPCSKLVFIGVNMLLILIFVLCLFVFHFDRKFEFGYSMFVYLILWFLVIISGCHPRYSLYFITFIFAYRYLSNNRAKLLLWLYRLFSLYIVATIVVNIIFDAMLLYNCESLSFYIDGFELQSYGVYVNKDVISEVLQPAYDDVCWSICFIIAIGFFLILFRWLYKLSAKDVKYAFSTKI